MNGAAVALDQIPTGPEGRRSRARFWDLVVVMALTEYRRRYAGSVLGYAWTLLRPLMLFAVLYAVFTRVIRFGDSVPDYAVLLLFNITLYFFFQEGTNAGLRSFVARGPVMRSIRVPPLVPPVSALLASSFTFAASLTVAIVWILVYGIEPTASWLLLPVLLLYLALLTGTVGILLSMLFVRYRDIGQAWHPLSRLLFYASPILYPFEFIPAGFFRDLASFNPLSPLFVQARHWIIDPTAPTWDEVAGGAWQTAAPFIVLFAITLISMVTYWRLRRHIAERV